MQLPVRTSNRCCCSQHRCGVNFIELVKSWTLRLSPFSCTNFRQSANQSKNFGCLIRANSGLVGKSTQQADNFSIPRFTPALNALFNFHPHASQALVELIGFHLNDLGYEHATAMLRIMVLDKDRVLKWNHQIRRQWSPSNN
jgi:hypothetical protein